jgi:hypothetical protein
MVGSGPASQPSYSTKPQFGIEVVADVQIKENSRSRTSLSFVGKWQEPSSGNSTVLERKMASPMDGDATKGLEQPCHGWPSLAHAIADNPCFEIFQTFRDLNIKSLLYYQAQLDQLRKELEALEWEDYRKDGNLWGSCSQNMLLAEADPIQAQLLFNKENQIREVLKDYRKTLTHPTIPEVHPLIFVTDAALLQYSKITEAEAFNFKSLLTGIVTHIRGTKPRPQSAPPDPRESHSQRRVCHLSLDATLHVSGPACSFQWQGY